MLTIKTAKCDLLPSILLFYFIFTNTNVKIVAITTYSFNNYFLICNHTQTKSL